MNQCDLKFLFDNIKDGDAFGFYRDQRLALTADAVKIATSAEIDHSSKIYEVHRTPTIVSFFLSHQVPPCARYDRHLILQYEGQYYLQSFGDPYVPGGLLATRVYYGQLKNALTPEQQARGLADAKNQIGKPYGYMELALAGNEAQKLLPEFLKKDLEKSIKTHARICSVHCLLNDMASGIITEHDFDAAFYPSPVEYLSMKHLNLFQLQGDYRNISCR